MRASILRGLKQEQQQKIIYLFFLFIYCFLLSAAAMLQSEF